MAAVLSAAVRTVGAGAEARAVAGLGLNVAMADAEGVDVRQGAAHLVGVQLHVKPRHALPRLAVVLADAVHRFRNELQHQIQVHLLAPPHLGIRIEMQCIALRQVD